MESVTVTRRIDADPEAIRAAIRDVEGFVRAGGYDEVAVEGDRVSIANAVGFVRIEIELAVVEDPDAALALRGVEGIFEELYTTYAVESDGAGAVVTATTEFELDAAFVGPVLDSTVVKRQRRREIERQFDHLDATVAEERPAR